MSHYFCFQVRRQQNALILLKIVQKAGKKSLFFPCQVAKSCLPLSSSPIVIAREEEFTMAVNLTHFPDQWRRRLARKSRWFYLAKKHLFLPTIIRGKRGWWRLDHLFFFRGQKHFLRQVAANYLRTKQQKKNQLKKKELWMCPHVDDDDQAICCFCYTFFIRIRRASVATSSTTAAAAAAARGKKPPLSDV